MKELIRLRLAMVDVQELQRDREELRRFRHAFKKTVADRDRTVANLKMKIAEQQKQCKNYSDDEEPYTCVIYRCPEDAQPVWAACASCGVMVCRACALGYSQLQGQQTVHTRQSLVLKCPICRLPKGIQFTG